MGLKDMKNIINVLRVKILFFYIKKKFIYANEGRNGMETNIVFIYIQLIFFSRRLIITFH